MSVGTGSPFRPVGTLLSLPKVSFQVPWAPGRAGCVCSPLPVGSWDTESQAEVLTPRPQGCLVGCHLFDPHAFPSGAAPGHLHLPWYPECGGRVGGLGICPGFLSVLLVVCPFSGHAQWDPSQLHAHWSRALRPWPSALSTFLSALPSLTWCFSYHWTPDCCGVWSFWLRLTASPFLPSFSTATPCYCRLPLISAPSEVTVSNPL